MPQPSNVSARRGRRPLTGDEIAIQRDRILVAASELFEQEGYSAISMRRLATAAGLTPMTLYAYFDGKPAILAALWVGLMEAALNEVESVVVTDPRARLIALCQAYVGHWIARPESYRTVFMTQGVSQLDVSGFLATTGLGERLEIFSQALAAAAPDWGQAVLKRRTDALLCGLQGVAHNHVTISGFGWTPAEELVAILVDGVLAA